MADTRPASVPKGASLRAYLLLVRATAPLLPLLLRRRLARGKEDPDRWREKLGTAGLPRPGGTLIWMHAVGLGEVLALRGLIAAMGAARPDLSFLVTSSARSSAQAFGGNMPPRTRHQFLPLDAPGPVAAFLDHWRPDLSVWAEQDLWPGLVVAAHGRGIPLALINARMNARAYRARARFRRLFADLYARFSHISAQDAATATHLRALGAGLVQVTGSLKASAGPLADDALRRVDMSALLATTGRRAWFAASTHPADEGVALAAQVQLFAKDPAHLLILAPRIPGRGDQIIAACHALGLPVAARSDGALPGGAMPGGAQPGVAQAVYLADSFGEMGLWFRLCRVAFIGGSMGGSMGGIGGHNPWEPAHLQCGIVHGPDVANFAADYAAFHAADAATKIADADGLVRAVLDPDMQGRAARAFDLAQNGMAGLPTLCAQLLALTPQARHA